MPTLRIELLGDYCLKLDGQPITSVSSPRLQALLAYLVLHRAAPQARQQIAFLFWPDFPEANARNNLRQLLFEFRRALPNAEYFLDLDGSNLCWRSDAPFSLDVAEFENALATAEQAGQNREQEREQAALETSAFLYHGDLLPSCYDDWIVPVRETLRQKAITALERLVDLLERQHDYRKALGHAQHLLRHDPLREATYRCLMRLHALSGDRAGVVRVYNTCVHVLQRELSVQASPVTNAEYEHWLKESLSPSRAPDRAQPPPETQRRHNLPFELTAFIGREREAIQVKELITAHRLVTLTGSGGVGKTRLALHIAADVLEIFLHGVWLVDLAPLSDPALVPQGVAAILEVREAPGSPLIDTLANYVREKRLMLILDNCEHLVDAVRHLAKTLVETAPNLRILATSREPLGIAGEVTWRVPSLPTPEERLLAERAAPNTPVSIMQFESLRLFVDRATAALPTFIVTDANAYDVAKICRQLDGIPLAIELAAARVKMLSPQQIAARLDRCFDLLTVGSRTALPRHRTLRATMDWSYQLLSEKERILLRRLSVFAGGFTVEAVEQVCVEQNESEGPINTAMILDLLSDLIDKSLVAVEQKDTVARYYLLETVRRYAQEKLIQLGEADRAKARHLDYFMRLVEQASLGWLGFEQPARLLHLKAEHDNFRAALEWSIADETTARIGLKMVGLVAPFLDVQGHFAEECIWINRLIEQAGEVAPPAWCAVSFQHAAMAHLNLGDFATAQSFVEQAITLCRKLDDKQNLAESLYLLGTILSAQAQFIGARPILEECLTICRDLGDTVGTAWSLSDLGLTVYALGDHHLGHAHLEQGLMLCRNGNSGLVHARLAWLWGDIFRHEGNLGQAKALFKEALNTTQAGIVWAIPYHIESFAYLALEEGFTLRSTKLFGAGDFLFEMFGAVRVPVMQSEHDRAIDDLRASLGEEMFAAAWEEGRAMSLDQAIEYASKDS